jgi:hypothetical protein
MISGGRKSFYLMKIYDRRNTNSVSGDFPIIFNCAEIAAAEFILTYSVSAKTRLILSMARDKKNEVSRGSVVVDFEVDAAMVFIIIKNTGSTAALNLKINPSRSVIGLEGKKDLRELSVFTEISYMAPLKEIRIFVDSYDSFFRNLKNTLISFTITYMDESDVVYKNKITHDLKIYADLIFFIKKS